MTEEIRTLGEFIKELEKCNPQAVVTLEPFGLYPTDFDSYRGYYSDLALGYKLEDDTEPFYVSDILEMAKECIGKTFTGYKGGEFTMSENSQLWISNYGEVSGVIISEIKRPLQDYVEIHCHKVED